MVPRDITSKEEIAKQVRLRLAEVVGATAQDLGFGRIAGQVLIHLYLSPGDCSLDQIEGDLGLSKAAASIAARQLESMGFLRRSWRQGDRKVYYRTADNLGAAFRDGMVSLLSRKLEVVGSELVQMEELIQSSDGVVHPEWVFLKERIKRARDLNNRAGKVLKSRILRYLAR